MVTMVERGEATGTLVFSHIGVLQKILLHYAVFQLSKINT
jgi:hypothetical protein